LKSACVRALGHPETVKNVIERRGWPSVAVVSLPWQYCRSPVAADCRARLTSPEIRRLVFYHRAATPLMCRAVASPPAAPFGG
jgi:hypothetical protein